MNADLSGLVDLLLTVVSFLNKTHINFAGYSLSLWSIFVTGAAASAISVALFGGEKDDD